MRQEYAEYTRIYFLLLTSEKLGSIIKSSLILLINKSFFCHVNFKIVFWCCICRPHICCSMITVGQNCINAWNKTDFTNFGKQLLYCGVVTKYFPGILRYSYVDSFMTLTFFLLFVLTVKSILTSRIAHAWRHVSFNATRLVDLEFQCLTEI